MFTMSEVVLNRLKENMKIHCHSNNCRVFPPLEPSCVEEVLPGGALRRVCSSAPGLRLLQSWLMLVCLEDVLLRLALHGLKKTADWLIFCCVSLLGCSKVTRVDWTLREDLVPLPASLTAPAPPQAGPPGEPIASEFETWIAETPTPCQEAL